MGIKVNRIFAVLVLLWMAVIFVFSSRNADLSGEDSFRVSYFVGTVLIDDFENWPEEQQTAFTERIDHAVRKTAHMTEYAVLGSLWMGALSLALKKRAFASWLLTTVYAGTDEFHQLFTDGRNGCLTDVGIDSLGGAAGIAVCLLIIAVFLKNKGSGRFFT